MAPLIAFIIGGGKNVGEHTAAALKAKGYQVAIGSRKPVVELLKKDGYFPVAVDGGNPESVQTAFAHVNKELGPPNVVIFNVGSTVTPPVEGDPLSMSLETFKEQMDTGLSLYAAAQEALKGFRTQNDALNTFIVTGNPLPWVPADRPAWLSLNMQKVMAWRLMEIFSKSYSKEGSRFYFASLVGETGGIVEPLSKFFTSGPQHAQVYMDLITRKDQADWEYRFTLDGKQWTK
ncbi:hypothetical protein MVEN_01123800 [Mycena venus]|uniref:NAD(P)-binding domain-containing protein n=1 Tax=Mycena venus TaxID=2733690 RepID=A0A8H6Y9J9_9AGAR|nr:hypothetical protein MVEN_01123800 [Mycena venus]